MPVRTAGHSADLMDTPEGSLSVSDTSISHANRTSLEPGWPSSSTIHDPSLEEPNATVLSVEQSWNSTQNPRPSSGESWMTERSSVAVEHRNGNSSGASNMEVESESATPEASASNQSTPTPVGRPRRAAASAANERMQLRTRTATKSAGPTSAKVPSPGSPATPDDASDGADDIQSPVRKRRKNRKTDPTFNVNDTNVPEEVSAIKAREKRTATFRTPIVSRKKNVNSAAGSRSKVLASGEPINLRSLCGILRVGEESLEKVVDSWVDVYKMDRLSGYLELANFFIHAAGCQGKISHNMAHLDHPEIIKQLSGKFDVEESNEYPIVKAGPEHRKFRIDFCKFLDTLLKTIKDSILFDDYLMDTLFRFLSELSDSSIRAFRHTATLGALKIMSTIVEISSELRDTLASDQRQLEMEGKRKRANQPRVQMLQQTFDQHSKNAESIKALFDKACKGVFYQRYRDAIPAVRELCMEELGEWMLAFPDRFVDDSYLKYLGWTLNDKEPSVRRKCLQVILPLYEREDLTSKLQLFSNKFKDRFVEMTADADPESCVKAIKILCAMDKTQSELFGNEDLDRLFELIYVTDRGLAVAAADFLLGRMAAVAQSDPDRQRGRKFRSGKEWTEDVWNIYEIVKFNAESPVHSHSAYLVDSLIDVCPSMKAWEAMTDLLLEEPAQGEPTLSEQHEQILIEIMSWALKHAATGESPTGRFTGKKTKAKELKQVQDDRTRLTTHFVSALPPLLNKFKQDMRKTGLLISVPQYFDVDVFTTNHKEEELDQLLDLIVELFEKSESDVFLRNCAKSLEALEQEGSGIVNRVALQKSTLTEAVTAKFRESLPSWLAGGSGTDVVYAFESSVMRLTSLFTFFDLSGGMDVWDDLFSIIQRGLEPENQMKRPLLRKVMMSCYLALLWRIQALRSRHGGSQPPDQEECAVHMTRLREFIVLLLPTLTVEQTATETVFAASQHILDLLLQHHAPPQGAPEWQFQLHFQLPNPDQLAISDFVDFQVFSNALPETTAADTRLTIIHKRRQLLMQFCRAFTCNVISSRYAATVFKNYISSNVDYGDIIKETIKKLFDTSKVHCAEAVAAALIDLFTSRVRSHKRNSKEILEIREMAKRFALLFGADNEKSRGAMGALHKYCVEFIRAAPNDKELAKRVMFFDVLSEFAPKLRRDDKARLVRRLDSLPNLPGGLKGEALHPFLQYRNSLAGSVTEDVEPADKHRRGRRVNAPVSKNAPLRLPTPELDEVASVVDSSVAGDAADDASQAARNDHVGGEESGANVAPMEE